MKCRRCLLFVDRPVHTLDLSIGPRVVGFGQAMLNLVGIADNIKAVHAELCRPTVPVPWLIGKLYPVIHCPAGICLQTPRGGQDDVDLVGNGFQNSLKKDYGFGPVRLFIEPNNGKF
jgi:hypothetical protein